MEKTFHTNGNGKNIEVAILISDKIDFRTKIVVRDKGRHSLRNDKEVHQQEDTTFIKIRAPNIGAPKYIKHILTDLKGEVESNSSRRI